MQDNACWFLHLIKCIRFFVELITICCHYSYGEIKIILSEQNTYQAVWGRFWYFGLAVMREFTLISRYSTKHAFTMLLIVSMK